MSRRLSLSDLNPAYLAKHREEIERQLGKPKLIGIAPVEDAPTAERRTKQRTKKTSALEERWGVKLRETFPHARTYEQFPLSIGNGCNYYVDFLAVFGGRDRNERLDVRGYEVKGPYSRTAGIVKLKAAATRFPWIRFFLVSLVNGKWREEEVFP
jgi:hypothetical protein